MMFRCCQYAEFDKKPPVLNPTPYLGFTTGKVFFFLKNIHFFTFPCLSVLVDKGWGARSSLLFFIIASLYFIIVNLNMLIA